MMERENNKNVRFFTMGFVQYYKRKSNWFFTYTLLKNVGRNEIQFM